MSDLSTTYVMIYRCPKCGTEWGDAWDSGVDADCPQCEERDISPIKTIEFADIIKRYTNE